MLYTSSKVENLEVINDILSGQIKLQDIDFHCHLMKKKYFPKMNLFKTWNFAERFEVSAENYFPKTIKFSVRIENGDIVFVTPNIIWEDVSLTAKHLVICYEDKIFLTVTFSKPMTTIKGYFTIDTSSNLFRIKMG